MPDILDQIRERLAEIAEHIPRDPTAINPAAPPIPDELSVSVRKRSRIVPMERQPAGEPGIEMEQARADLDTIIGDYITARHAPYRLLCAIPPGVGKTFAAVKWAMEAANQGLRVIYVAPRHDFFDTIIETCEKQGGDSAMWFHWLPRQAGAGDDPETCHLAGYIDQWIKRGHVGYKFCAGVCGFDFMGKKCRYHAQTRNAGHRRQDGTYKITVIQHAHLVTGHPLLADADLVIGDESPLGVYPHIWTIPPTYIVPQNLEGDNPAYPLVVKIKSIATTIAADVRSSGKSLLDALGGPRAVLAAVESADVLGLPVDIHAAENADRVPYDYLGELTALLAQEARAALAGSTSWVPRVIVAQNGITLLLKKLTANDLPARTLWLDATADPEIYRDIIGWHVEMFAPAVKIKGPIFQVTDSLYTKGVMVAGEKPSRRAKEVGRLVNEIIRQHGYKNPLIVSYKELATLFPDKVFTHFYGNRGSNSFEECDSVFILGTPQPPVEQIELSARMFYPARTQPFNDRWVDKLIQYPETDQGYMAAGLWADRDLERILLQLREAEIVQSAHRVRPIVSSKPIWLMTALPVPSLPPTRLITAAQAIGITIEDIDALTFIDVLDIVRVEVDRKGHCTTQDIMLMLKMVRQTAYRYFDALEQYDPINFAPIKIRAVSGRGAPSRGVGDPAPKPSTESEDSNAE